MCVSYWFVKLWAIDGKASESAWSFGKEWRILRCISVLVSGFFALFPPAVNRATHCSFKPTGWAKNLSGKSESWSVFSFHKAVFIILHWCHVPGHEDTCYVNYQPHPCLSLLSKIVIVSVLIRLLHHTHKRLLRPPKPMVGNNSCCLCSMV